MVSARATSSSTISTLSRSDMKMILERGLDQLHLMNGSCAEISGASRVRPIPYQRRAVRCTTALRRIETEFHRGAGRRCQADRDLPSPRLALCLGPTGKRPRRLCETYVHASLHLEWLPRRYS